MPVVLSAQGPRALERLAGRLHARLTEKPDTDLYSLAHALAVGRAVFDHRAVVVGRSREELLAGLECVAAGGAGGDVLVGRAGGARKLALVFAGQGSQRVGMGRELYALSPVFAGAFDEVCAAFDGLLERPLRELVLGAGSDEGTLAQTRFAQPAVFAVEVALFRLLESLGVRPDFVAGHSVGELVAAYVAGVWSLPDAARLVAARGRLMQAAPGGGVMVSVRLSEGEVRAGLGALGVEGVVSVAAVNGPRQTVVSGDAGEVERVVEFWRAQGHRTRRLLVSHAFHSSHMEAVVEEFRRVAASVRCAEPRVAVVSADSGRVAGVAELADPGYWAGHIRRTVRFADAVRCLRGEGVSTFLEVAGDQALAQQIEETLDGLDGADGVGGGPGRVVAGVTADPKRLLAALARVHVDGVDIDWPAWFARTPATAVDLPTYPFDHHHYWLAPHALAGDARRFGLADTADHPLLGALVTPAEGEGLLLSGLLSLRTHPWLADHTIAGSTLLPGTAFLELALQAARAADCDEVTELTLEQPLVLPARGAVQIQVVVQGADEQGHRALAVHSRTAETDGEHDRPWTCHATGTIAPKAPRAPQASAWLPAGAMPLDLDDAYPRLADDGYAYGPAFRGLRAAWSSGTDLYAEVEIAESQRAEAARCGLHPALLDAVLHALAVDGLTDGGGTQVPFSFTGVRLHAHGATVLRARLRRTDSGVAITLTDPTGEIVADIGSLAMRAFDARGAVAVTGRRLHVVRWTPLPAEAAGDGALPDAVVVRVPAAGGTVSQVVAGALDEVRDRLSGDGRVVVVTASGDVAGAAVGGLVRSVQAEYPGRVFLVEADASGGEELLGAALAGGEPHVRLRDGQVLVPRLTRAGEPVGAGPVFGPEGTVLVTGATGTLGRLVVRHLV
ncbi:type I polyketide synthase, partial [Streptomyces sp. NPDC052020]|uniref:type I polyketide synthase n=1 Tax=Streptomyces sp. NPDC052020 TaxID=3155677 RepID=UPI003430B19C